MSYVAHARAAPAHTGEGCSGRSRADSNPVADLKWLLAPLRVHGFPSLAVVLVVAAPPEAGLVATEWRAVEPLVHAPEAVDPAPVCGVGVVDDTALEHERAHAGPFSPVRREVRSNARCPLGEHGTPLGGPKVHRVEVVVDGARVPLLLGMRGVEVVVEVAVER